MASTIDRTSGNARLPAAAQDVDAMDCQFRGSACGERSADHEAASSPKAKWPGEPFAGQAAAAAAASLLNCVRKGSPPALVRANLAVVASFLDAASAHGEDRVVATQTGH